jgi:hypothetical protein
MRGADGVWASSRRYGGLTKQVGDGRRVGGAVVGARQVGCRTLGLCVDLSSAAVHAKGSASGWNEIGQRAPTRWSEMPHTGSARVP